MDARFVKQLIYALLLLIVLLGLSKRADAQSALSVAVAANFAPAMEEVSRNFSEETSIPVQVTISSSGRLFAQIEYRAPFDLFFSADSERPEQLYSKGVCGKPVRYATGRTVLWSSNRNFCALEDWQDVVLRPDVTKIAIANPEIAPYGTAARQVLTQMESWPVVEKRLVYSTNVGQAFQYAQSGVAQAAFVALSLALSEQGSKGCFWKVRESMPVEQMACRTSYSSNPEAAERFLQYAVSTKTSPVREKFGYE